VETCFLSILQVSFPPLRYFYEFQGVLTMRSTKLFIGLLTFLAMGHYSPVQAQCLQSDVSLQYNISGSQQPTQRTNDVVMESDRGCTGNRSVTTGVQGNVGGTNPVEQHRRVRHEQKGGQGNRTGVNGSNVQIRSNVGVDVYNPADNFSYP
jgi:hypothetical protein